MVPPNGPAFINNSVTVWGKAFVGPEWGSKFGVRIFFGGTEGRVEKINDDFTVIKCVTPAAAPGRVNVMVQTAKGYGTQATKKRDNFEFNSTELVDGYEFSAPATQPVYNIPTPTEDEKVFQNPTDQITAVPDFLLFDDPLYDGFDFIFSAYTGQMDSLRNTFDPGFIDIPDDIGATPLIWAAYCGHVEVTEFLLENGADPNIATICKEYPLHLAAEIGSLDIVKALVKHGAKVNCVNRDRETPLLYAAEHSPVVDFLTEASKKPTTAPAATEGERTVRTIEKPTSYWGGTRRYSLERQSQERYPTWQDTESKMVDLRIDTPSEETETAASESVTARTASATTASVTALTASATTASVKAKALSPPIAPELTTASAMYQTYGDFPSFADGESFSVAEEGEAFTPQFNNDEPPPSSENDEPPPVYLAMDRKPGAGGAVTQPKTLTVKRSQPEDRKSVV